MLPDLLGVPNHFWFYFRSAVFCFLPQNSCSVPEREGLPKEWKHPSITINVLTYCPPCRTEIVEERWFLQPQTFAPHDPSVAQTLPFPTPQLTPTLNPLQTPTLLCWGKGAGNGKRDIQCCCLLQVLGDKDADGFYHGEASGRAGLVPCNMVSEIQVDDEGIMEQLLQRGYLAPSTSMHRLVQSAAWEDVKYRERRSLGSGAQPGPPRRMMAMFDYNPRESSPNVDIEAELTFSAGDIITVYGDMDEDGFYNGNLNGQHGLVPSNFLEVHPENEPKTSPTLHPVANRERPRIWADAQLAGLSEHAVSTSAYSPDPALSPDSQRHGSVDSGVDGDQHDWADDGERHNGNKKKRGFFSKGKKLFKRLGSSKREQPPLGVRGQYNTK
uniref:SH3 domain-containing protein n=1 Tax=Callorhinchus milii TaxID=7868 RepID=A0A4W3KEL7_CALMI